MTDRTDHRHRRRSRPVLETSLAEHFDNESGRGVSLLDTRCASEVWVEYFGEGSHTFFSLEDSSWVVATTKVFVGEWLEDFNLDATSRVTQLLKDSITWNLSDSIYFCVSDQLIVCAPWSVFVGHWACFLSIDDDCPIIIRKDSKRLEAIVFRSIGDFYAARPAVEIGDADETAANG